MENKLTSSSDIGLLFANVLTIYCLTTVIYLTRSSADADNGLDVFSGQSSQQTWYHFGSIATFR